jgi:heme/copper-type cytochrome/quinol oxidase subunit 2
MHRLASGQLPWVSFSVWPISASRTSPGRSRVALVVMVVVVAVVLGVVVGVAVVLGVAVVDGSRSRGRSPTRQSWHAELRMVSPDLVEAVDEAIEGLYNKGWAHAAIIDLLQERIS